MTAFVALLRAVNVGGTGKLPMAELRAMCGRAGFVQVSTYTASGNAVFAADMTEAEVTAALVAQVEAYAGKPVGVLVRTAAEMADVLARNPFPDAPPSRTVAIFLPTPPPPDTLAGVRHRTSEEVGLGAREVYVAYGETMGRSRLAVPAVEGGTVRNMNTVAELARMAGGLRNPAQAGLVRAASRAPFVVLARRVCVALKGPRAPSSAPDFGTPWPDARALPRRLRPGASRPPSPRPAACLRRARAEARSGRP